MKHCKRWTTFAENSCWLFILKNSAWRPLPCVSITARPIQPKPKRTSAWTGSGPKQRTCWNRITMRNKENKTDWIDSYLDGELQGNELEEFGHLLESDKDFRLEVEAHKAVRGSLQQWGDKELKSKFRKYHSRLKTGENPGPKAGID